MYNCRNKINYFNYSPYPVVVEDENVEDFFTPIQALSHGNLSKNLYKGYKGYQQVILSAENPMTVLQAYNFILLDLGLYLDVNPNDQEAIKLYNAYMVEYRNLVKNFERLNYHLQLNDVQESTNSWEWVKNWQVKGGNK